MSNAQVKMPRKLAPLFSIPRGDIRYRIMFGGRGSGKSFNAAKMAAIFGYAERLRILCTRELQSSIRESFHAELKKAIESEPFLKANYSVGASYITGANGTEFIFAGLRHNIASIKSMAQVDLCIVEEAEDIPESSWIDLVPTIRADKSEIWVLFNPRTDGSATDRRFRKNIDADMAVVEINYQDNSYFPKVLEGERLRDLRNCDPSVYAHIWEGCYLSISDAQVLKGKVSIEEFTPMEYWDGPYFGADWGFSVDPTTLVKLWIHAEVLYIEHEAYGIGVEIDHTSALFKTVPGSEHHVIRADNARPETISYMRRAGFNIRGAVKGKGSLEDGVAHLRSYAKIIIHPRCVHAIEESRLWRYKTDRLSGDILPVLVDAYNHIYDAVRYALEPVMHSGTRGHSITTPQQKKSNIW